MEDLDVPAFLIERREAVVGQLEITRSQIENTAPSVFVCKDLLGHDHGKVQSLDEDLDQLFRQITEYVNKLSEYNQELGGNLIG